MRLIGPAGAFAAWATFVFGVPSAKSEPRSVQSGVYTKDQAEEGRKIFEQICMSCHQRDEFGQGEYMDGWTGMMVSDLVDLVSSTMPQDSPGRLKQSEYIAIAAFLFEINGVPAGETEMDNKAAKEILIEGPFGGKDD